MANGKNEDIDQMIDELDNLAPGKRNSKTWSPPGDKEGSYPVRILPPLKKSKGEKVFVMKHMSHWLGDTNLECLDQTLVDKNGVEHQAESCPICAASKHYWKHSEEKTPERDLAYNLMAKPKYVARAVLRGSEDETKPVFWEFGKKIFEMLRHIIKETEYGDITDPNNGNDFIITKKGTKKTSNYDLSAPKRDSSPIFKEKERMAAVLQNAATMEYNSLIEFVTYDRAKEMLKAFLSDGVEEESQEAPTPKQAKVPSAGKVASPKQPPAQSPLGDDEEEEASDSGGSSEEDPIGDLLNDIVF